jgi:ribosome-binding factor A
MPRGSGKFNKEKYQEKIALELNRYLRGIISDPRLINCSITKVELNVDYSVAQVYWDTYDANHRGDIKAGIEQSSSKLRALLAKNLDLRHVPELKFHYDSQYEDEMKISLLLQKNKKETEE